LLSEGDDPFGRIDLHFGSSVVHGVLIVERDLATTTARTCPTHRRRPRLDAGPNPVEDFLVTVYRGTEVASISDRDGDR